VTRGFGNIVAALAVAGVALLAPASAGAATTLGQLRQPPAGIADCDPGKVYVQRTSTGSIRYSVPAGGGVISSWAVRPGLNANQAGSFKVLRDNGDNSFTVLATTAAQNLNSQENVDSFPVRIPVQGGEFIAYSPTAQADQQCIIDNTGAGNDTWSGTSAAAVGATFPVANEYPGRSLNLQASLEPDADRDGFGDETQDRCPTQAATSGQCAVVGGGGGNPPADKTKPTFGSLSFSRSAFKAAGSGAAFTTQKKKGRKKSSAPVGTKVSYTLSEASAVRFTVQRKATGRRVKGKCRTRTRKNRKKSKCTLWKNVRGSFTVAGKPGKNTFTFRGRIGGKALKTGGYRLNGTATDPAKNRSTPKNKTFRIVR